MLSNSLNSNNIFSLLSNAKWGETFHFASDKVNTTSQNVGMLPFNFGTMNSNMFNSGMMNFGNFDFTQMFNFTPQLYGQSQIYNQSPVQSGNCKPKVKLDGAFLAKVKQIAQRVGCSYKDLLGVMNCESGLNSRAVNSSSGATGLIQFMPATARRLGTTTAALKNMTPIQQLDFVEKYLLNSKNAAGLNGRNISAGELYALVFMPAKAKQDVMATSGTAAYAANKGLDTNKDGYITKNELGNKVISRRVNESIFSA